jgi:hypothetical protein
MRARLPGQNNPYWTPKHDYRCAVEWCLRYPDWKKELMSLPEVNKGIAYDKDKVQTNSDYDATAELAIRRVEIEGKINLLETTAKLCMPELTKYLIMGVTEDGITYNALHTRGMPYSQNAYFKIRQKFYHLIAKRI